MKMLVWIIVIAVALLALRLTNIAAARRRNASAASASPRSARADTMVRCVRCGVYVPSGDAKSSVDGVLCGEPGCGKRP